ncbi:MAG TPA: hypothetical protein VET27_06090 [Mycobacterium sp.]|nr:hypothetical protein [Mycobacterium sp.]
MNANTTTLRRFVASALGASAIAVGALAMSSPAGAVTFEQSCKDSPGLYATGAESGVYSTVRRGVDRDQICKLYGRSGNHLGTSIVTDYGFYKAPSIPKVAPAPVLSPR